MRLTSERRLAAPVLDAGCGTGEHALHVASLGYPVLGVDVAETAIAIARQKSRDRGIVAEFAVADALHLERLGRTFRTVLDCGLFHTFDAAERSAYAASLASVTERDGMLTCCASVMSASILIRTRSVRTICELRSAPSVVGPS